MNQEKIQRLLSKETYEELSELFEESETKLIGEGGYDKYLAVVKLIERQLNINNISMQSVEVEQYLHGRFRR